VRSSVAPANTNPPQAPTQARTDHCHDPTKETAMTQFNRPSRLTRSLSAAGALLTTVLMLSGVVGLALHYEQRTPVQSAAAVHVAASAAPAA
jgi:hypothetical protein